MESWADHTAWVSSTDKKGDKKQQMGHVFTKTTLQDTGLLCSNETVVPSCHTLARTLVILWIKEHHAWLEKQQANSCWQIHMQKKPRKQSKSTAPTLTHPDESWDTTLRTTQATGLGRKRRGEGSCRWDHGIHPGRQPAFPLLLVRPGFPGGCWRQVAAVSPRSCPGSPACTCRARRQLWLDSSSVSQEAKRAAGDTCRAKHQWTCSSGGFAKLRFKATSFFSGLQTLFCCKSGTFSPMFFVSRSHTVICKATLPAKCKCCPGHINNLQWWFLSVRIPPLLNLVRKNGDPLSQAQKRIET